ncbi:MAG: ABC transporter substrate-binding protein [Syntrophaceae bacterium]|nr:ABC transporter substrate-binding protein [Syntrophaceae bacterium]
MKKNLLLVWGTFCLSLFWITSPAVGAEKITLKLNWVPGGDHCFYYVAKEKGLYKEKGLEVAIERGQGSGDTVKRVELNTVDVGLADTGTLVVARSKGAKVQVIGMIYSKSPNGIKTWRGSGITKPKDLEGRKVGVPPGDAQRVLWPALAAANGIDMNKVALINIQPAAKAQSLAAKQVDAVFDWIVGNQGYWEAGLDKDKLVLIPWAQWGVNPYGNALMASEKTIKERPDMLRRFMDATMQGWKWAIENPDQASEIFIRSNPEVPLLAALGRFADDLQGLVDVPMNQKYRLGWIDKARMEETVNILNKYFQVDRPVTAQELYTVEFLPDIKMPPIDRLPTMDQVYKKWESQKK